MSNTQQGSYKVVYLKLILAMIFWGAAFVSGRILTQKFDPFTVATLRFAIASFFLVSFLIYKKPCFYKINFIQSLKVLSLGATGVFSYNYFFFNGLKLVEAGRSSVMIASNPGLTAFIAILFLGEAITLKKLVGFICTLLGILLVVSKGDLARFFSHPVGEGELYLLGAVVSWVTYTILGKVFLKKITSLEATTWACLIGTILLFPFALNNNFLNELSQVTLIDFLHFSNIGLLATCLGFIWFYDGVAKLGAATAASFINLVPLVGVGCGVLFLGESLSFSLVFGSMIVIVGVYLVNKRSGLKQVGGKKLIIPL